MLVCLESWRSAAIGVLIGTVAISGCATPLFSGPPAAMPGANRVATQSTPPAETFRDWSPPEREKIAAVQAWVQRAAEEHDLEPELINAVIWVESRFEPRAKSPAGARGLMQLMPATASSLAQSMGRTRASSYDPEFNIAAGTLYLAKMRKRYDGDLRLALAAYNAGAGNVDAALRKQGGLPAYSERYVALVMAAKARFDAIHPLPAEADKGTRIASATPARATPAASVAPTAPALAPAPAPQHPDDPPVRYDLDRVESTYTPTIEPEPPLPDTARAPRSIERTDRDTRPTAREPRPTAAASAREDTSPSPSMRAETERSAKEPVLAPGVLPSVLD